MRRFTISPARYRQVTFAALIMVSAIIVTGAAVRVTGSGLGCPDWPTCTSESLVPPMSYHPLVEFVNRVFTGALSLTVVVLVLASLARRPRRRDLVWLSAGVAFGIPIQIVIGGLSVLFELVPPIVMAHFLASMPIVAAALVLHRRAGIDDELIAARPPARRDLTLAGNALVIAAAVVLFTGTIVTGAGPHGGDPDVERFDVAVSDVAQIHSVAVWFLVAVALASWWLARRPGGDAGGGASGSAVGADTPAAPRIERAFRWLLAMLVAQGAIGYTQYFTGVPAGLVLVHVAGSVAVWIAVVHARLALSEPVAATVSANLASERRSRALRIM